MKSKITAPFRFDHVGSFLRPDAIKEARLAYTNQTITKEDLREIENTAIKDLVAKQKAVGILGITDGEFRRSFWHIDFLEHLNGIEGYSPEKYNQQFQGTDAPAYNFRVIGRLSFNQDHPFLDDYRFLAETVGTEGPHIAKMTIPSPAMIIRQEILMSSEQSHVLEIYEDLDAFYSDIITSYQDAILAFYEAGNRYLQFDDTNWAFLIDNDKRAQLEAKGLNPDHIADLCRDIINAVLTVKPADMIITTHICRGNHASSWIFSGGYGPIAKQLFATNYDGFFLEYDSDRAGDFEPLKYAQTIPSHIVLGLITSKTADLEDSEQIVHRIKEATEYIPLDRLAISPQCGFASTEVGNKLTEEQQWDKLRLLNTIAKQVWS